ncbi:MAG: hypothetical protein P857_264 [Candidatus Xenolissoclinum pacificiensis L6]|uniref:MPN domain-containing protein n=1 Tax=Candidatus Xenolissoclinum pacificiensis L6 TaxID=1401685 RepID=W2V1N9_9RICK|nr:MAG: hypothetical protein P857_264 [Candidatus Xenolissoclinum pacificiensis L6]
MLKERKGTDLASGHRSRMKERLFLSPIDDMTDLELLEIFLFSTHTRRDVKTVASKLLEYFGSLKRIFFSDNHDLVAVPGVTKNIASMIIAVRELLHRITRNDLQNMNLLDNTDVLLEYLKNILSNSVTKEKLVILYMDSRYRLITQDVHNHGTVDKVPLYVREVIKKGLCVGTRNIIIAHNHLSNICKPSVADIDITNDLKEACGNLDIVLLDHIIITEDNYFSFYSNDLL